MTQETPKPLWEGITLEQVTDDYIHLGTEYGHGLMVMRHLPAHRPTGMLHPDFCDEVGRLLLAQ